MDLEQKQITNNNAVKLKTKKVSCGWPSCSFSAENKEDFYPHVSEHIPNIEIAENEEGEGCLFIYLCYF